MRKQLFARWVFTLVVGAALPMAAHADSGSTSSSSAGLGVDYTALVSAGGTGNPGLALPGSSSANTVRSPIAGIARHFARAKRPK
ncbi:hypothetical protein [Solimonas soli]|uniref:hypothetical protein n=1 Tax=Solimonas soli TaxID=413479 RepID=UPI00048878EF|nr:hypothetical protein [Solimonas soli]